MFAASHGPPDITLDEFFLGRGVPSALSLELLVQTCCLSSMYMSPIGSVRELFSLHTATYGCRHFIREMCVVVFIWLVGYG